MAITLNGSATSAANSTPTTTTLVINKPASLADGDVMVATITVNTNTGTASAPAGWLAVPGPTWPLTLSGTAGPRQYAYYKVVSSAAGETATYTFSITVTCKNGGGIQAYSGVDNTTPWDVDASSSTASGTPLAITGITTATAAAWLVSGCSMDADSSATLTAPGTMAEEFQTAGKRTSQAYEAFPTAGATGTRTWTGSTSALPMGGWLGALRPAAAAAAAFLPYRPGRRRFVPPRHVRPRPGVATPVPGQLIPPYPSAGVRHPERLRALNPRRERAVRPVPGQLIPPQPPAGIRHPGARLRGLLPRRGQPAQAVPAQVVIAPPAFVPQTLRSRVKLYFARRRAVSAVPADQPAVIQAARARLKLPRPARGHTAQPAPAQAAPSLPPGYVAQGFRARVRSLRLFRARTAQPVPPQVIVPPPTFVPNRARQATVRAATARRGHGVSPPVPQAPAPLFTRIKLRAVRVFRGKPCPVVPAQVIVVPPPYPPQPMRGKKRPWTIRRRRAPLDGWIVSTAHSCTTARPSTGTTLRPGSGTTTYALATTTRPNTGTTSRPSSGVTENPC